VQANCTKDGDPYCMSFRDYPLSSNAVAREGIAENSRGRQGEGHELGPHHAALGGTVGLDLYPWGGVLQHGWHLNYDVLGQ